MLGTHTHVPTADECILPGGTAFQCDVGMTGPYDSILGRRIDRVMETTLTGLPTQFDVATDDVRLCGTIVDVDPATGQATAIERLCVTEADLPRLEARHHRTRRIVIVEGCSSAKTYVVPLQAGMSWRNVVKLENSIVCGTI